MGSTMWIITVVHFKNFALRLGKKCIAGFVANLSVNACKPFAVATGGGIFELSSHLHSLLFWCFIKTKLTQPWLLLRSPYHARCTQCDGDDAHIILWWIAFFFTQSGSENKRLVRMAWLVCKTRGLFREDSTKLTMALGIIFYCQRKILHRKIRPRLRHKQELCIAQLP